MRKIGHCWCGQMEKPKHGLAEGKSGRAQSLDMVMGNAKLTS